MTKHIRRHPLALVAVMAAAAILLEPVVVAAVLVTLAAVVLYGLHRDRRERRAEIVMWLMDQGFADDTLREIASQLQGWDWNRINAEREAYDQGFLAGISTPRTSSARGRTVARRP